MTDKRAALEAEATDSTVRTFEYKDVSYKVEGSIENWDVEVMLAYEDGKSISVVRSLLGPEQWAKFMATKPKNKDFSELADKLFATIGTTEGESEG